MKEKLECGKCGSRYIYTTLNKIVCRKCGYSKKRKSAAASKLKRKLREKKKNGGNK